MIIASSLLGEEEGPKLVESMRQERVAPRSSTEVPSVPKQSQPNIPSKTSVEQVTEVSREELGSSVEESREQYERGEK